MSSLRRNPPSGRGSSEAERGAGYARQKVTFLEKAAGSFASEQERSDRDTLIAAESSAATIAGAGRG